MTSSEKSFLSAMAVLAAALVIILVVVAKNIQRQEDECLAKGGVYVAQYKGDPLCLAPGAVIK